MLQKPLADRRRVKRGFRRRLYARWRDGLDRLEMLLIIAQESHNNAIDDFLNPESKRTRLAKTQFEALIRLHAKACRTLEGVLSLLECGDADGANARWRSLHEVAVISYFLSKKPAKFARLYLEHEAIERYKAAQQFQIHAPSLGYKPFNATEMIAMQKIRDQLVNKYGKAFEGDYGWAAGAIRSGRPTFAEIERKSGFDKWRPYYKMASHSIHAGAQGSNFFLWVPRIARRQICWCE